MTTGLVNKNTETRHFSFVFPNVMCTSLVLFVGGGIVEDKINSHDGVRK